MTDFGAEGKNLLVKLGDIFNSPNRQKKTLSKLITLILDNNVGESEIEEIRKFEKNRPYIICITGLPGAGKSTLLNSLLRQKFFANHAIAVLAIDPTSRESGGAFLGDRIRLTEQANLEEMFFRSVGHRQSPTTFPKNLDSMAIVFGQFNYKFLFVETVGMGQTQDVVPDCINLIINVQTLANGDEIQFTKSGLIQKGDIVFFNKVEDEVSTSRLALIRSLLLEESNASKMKEKEVVFGSTRLNKGLDEITTTIVERYERFLQNGF